MRRLPTWVYPLVPLALALLYAALWHLLAPRPQVDDVVPPEAVVTARFRGLAGLDALWCFGREPNVRPAEDLADRHNVPGLPGVDRSGFFHWVLLPRSGRADPTLWIVPVSDAGTLRARFNLEDGALDASRAYRRHAKHLEIRGDFAALAWDREVVRHMGGGGLTLADRGEDFGLAIDLRGAAELALAQPGTQPWRSMLEALGGEPAKAVTGVDRASGERTLVYPFGRIVRVAEAWSTARLWAWSKEQRIEVELEPRDATLRERFARAYAGPRTPPPPAPQAGPQAPQAWLHVPHAAAFDALAAALEGSGVALSALLAPATGDEPFGARAFVNQADANAWTLEFDVPAGYEAPLAGLLGPLPAPGTSLPIAAGAALATVATTRRALTSPPGHLSRSAQGTRLALGADAERIAGAQPAPAGAEVALPDLKGRALLAVATLHGERALALLGPALQPGGVFAALGPGALRLVVSTDGARLFVDLARMP